MIRKYLCRFGRVKSRYLNGKQDEAFDEALNALTEQRRYGSKVRLCDGFQRALGFLVRKNSLTN